MSEVLVVLVNYNSPEDTYRCLRSFANSSNQPQVVIVDNGSSGNGLIDVEYAKSCYVATKIIFNPYNDGFGRGNNVGLNWGIENTTAEYFFVLNNDTIVMPNTIDGLIKYLQENPVMGMCSPAIFRLNEPDIYWFGGGYIEWKAGGAISPNINRRLGHEIAVLHNTFISGCAMFMRREVLVQVGGFSEDFFMYCEDTDYCQRVLDTGYEIGYTKNIEILHDAHASVIKDRDKFTAPHHWSNKNLTFPVQNIVYGSLLNLKKHARGFERLMGLMRIALRYSRWCFSYLVHGRMDGVLAVLNGIKFYAIGKPPE